MEKIKGFFNDLVKRRDHSSRRNPSLQFVLRADDNGEGGTFALYSLLCRQVRVNSLPNCQLADEEIIEYNNDNIGLTSKSNVGSRLKSTLEKHMVLQSFLFVLALIGTCMVIGDGILTPAISSNYNSFIDLISCGICIINWICLIF